MLWLLYLAVARAGVVLVVIGNYVALMPVRRREIAASNSLSAGRYLVHDYRIDHHANECMRPRPVMQGLILVELELPDCQSSTR